MAKNRVMQAKNAKLKRELYKARKESFLQKFDPHKLDDKERETLARYKSILNCGNQVYNQYNEWKSMYEELSWL